MKDEACVAAGGVPARRERSMTLGEIDALNARRRILREPRLASRDGDDSSVRVSLDEENRVGSESHGIAPNRTESDSSVTLQTLSDDTPDELPDSIAEH